MPGSANREMTSNWSIDTNFSRRASPACGPPLISDVRRHHELRC